MLSQSEATCARRKGGESKISNHYAISVFPIKEKSLFHLFEHCFPKILELFFLQDAGHFFFLLASFYGQFQNLGRACLCATVFCEFYSRDVFTFCKIMESEDFILYSFSTASVIKCLSVVLHTCASHVPSVSIQPDHCNPYLTHPLNGPDTPNPPLT